jgi:uncharacterized protein
LREQEEKKGDRWLVLGRVLLFMCSCAVVLAATAPIAASLRGSWPELAIGTVAGLGAFALTMLFVRWEKLRMVDVGAALGPRSLARLAFGFLVGLLLVSVWASTVLAAGHVRWVHAPGFDVRAATVALAGYFALSCREELAFHGYPLRRLERLFGLWVAQIFVALVFAAEHKLGGSAWIDALLGPAVGSLLFGMAAIATRGLAVPIGLHAAWNFGQWSLGMKAQPGFLKFVVREGGEQRVHLIGMMTVVSVMVVATFAFWLWHRRVQADLSRAQQS